MKIILIRHGKVNMDWEKSYDSKGFDEANANYDISPLYDYQGRTWKPEGFQIYISGLQRTFDTANQVFEGDFGFIKTELLNEVPKRSYKDSKAKLPRFWWTFRSRMQWYLNSSRQPEVRKQTVARAKELVDMIEKEGKDCILISHEFFLYTLKGELEKRGYLIERGSTFRIKNWERIRASKRDMHCGVCSHNCLLTNPGCDVGRDAASRQGVELQ